MRYSIFSILFLLAYVRIVCVAGENHNVYIRFKQYDFNLYNKVVFQKDFKIQKGNNKYVFVDSKWNLTIDTIAMPDAHPGWVNERIGTTDWNEGIGEMMQGSTWAETAMLYTYTQIPGVYICPGNSEVICFDNIETEIIEENKKSIKVKITNPTAFDANVRIWEEDIAGKRRALGANYLFNCREILIKARDEINISFKK